MRRLVAVLCVSVMVPSALACGASVSEEEAASSGEDSLRTLSASEILGNLAYGAESQVTYKRTPYYRAYRFTGAKGDQVVARVSSPFLT